MSESQQQVILSRTNDTESVIYLWVEPWAEEYELAPGSRVEVTMRGSPIGAPEIDESPNRMTIYAPGEVFLDVRIDDVVQQAASSQIVAPDAGELGTRGFVDVVFGNFPAARPGGMPAPPKEPAWRRWLSKIFRS